MKLTKLLPTISLSAFRIVGELAIAATLFAGLSNAASDPNKPVCSTLYPGATAWFVIEQTKGKPSTANTTIPAYATKLCHTVGQKPTRTR